MELPVSARRLPVRAATGAWILHSGIEKWGGGEDEAKAHHSMTAIAFPFVKKVPPPRFLRIVAGGEIAMGTVMLAPFISSGLAGSWPGRR